MKLRFLVPALALALTTLAAHAQIGLYLNPVVSRVSNSTPDTGPFAFLGEGGTSKIFGGVDFGGYYEFAHTPKMDVSVDARDTMQRYSTASFTSFMVGPRIQTKPIAYNLKPYAQLSIGVGRTKAPLSPATVSKLQYGIYVGLDKSIKKHIDWRIIEVSYGSVTTINSQLFRGPTPIPAASVLGFSTGLVFRFR
ncbi:MAG TPA: hypothetical protein VIJ38_14835 [Acidobacteriaceae bacterium]